MALTGRCHCGGAGWTFTGAVERATACNCTVCHRYGSLWAYGHDGETVRMEGDTTAYVRADEPDPHVENRFCPTCGNLIGWRGLKVEDGRRRMGVNLRLAELDAVARCR